MTLKAAASQKLAKLIPRLASTHDGEVVATVRAMQRTLQSSGADLHDLVAALTEPPAETVVYRDVYRDRPSERFWKARDLDPTIAPNDVLFAAQILVGPGSKHRLSRGERGERAFVVEMQLEAHRFGAKFIMTGGQAARWRTIIKKYMAEDAPKEKAAP